MASDLRDLARRRAAINATAAATLAGAYDAPPQPSRIVASPYPATVRLCDETASNMPPSAAPPRAQEHNFCDFLSFSEHSRTVALPRACDNATTHRDRNENLRDLAAACDARAADLVAAFAAPDTLADRAAIEADAWTATRPPPARTDPPADLVDRLALAAAAPRPWQHVTDAERGGSYFRAEALRRLAPLDELARGLLVQHDEAEARRHGGQTR